MGLVLAEQTRVGWGGVAGESYEECERNRGSTMCISRN